MRKIITLCLALLLPGLIFLFLKFFGKNEFDVTPLYQQADSEFPSACHIDYPVPYLIPDSVMQRFGAPAGSTLRVLAFIDSAALELPKQINRVEEAFAGESVTVFRLEEKNTGSLDWLQKCVFLLEKEQTVVLLDASGKIYGQYEGASLDDMDRLIVELKILLKQY